MMMIRINKKIKTKTKKIFFIYKKFTSQKFENTANFFHRKLRYRSLTFFPVTFYPPVIQP